MLNLRCRIWDVELNWLELSQVKFDKLKVNWVELNFYKFELKVIEFEYNELSLMR